MKRQLRMLGARASWLKMRAKNKALSIKVLFALEGAIAGLHEAALPAGIRRELTEWFNALPEPQRITPPGSNLQLQSANFWQQSDKEANLLKNQRCFAVASRVNMRNTLSQFIQRVLNARLIGWSVMKRVIDIAYGVIQQGEDGRVSQFLTVGTQRRNIAGEGMVQAEQAESPFPEFLPWREAPWTC